MKRDTALFPMEYAKSAARPSGSETNELLLPTTARVPKLIHQIWIQGAAAVPPKYAEARASWTRLNPSWTVRVWDNASITTLIRQHFGEAAVAQYTSIPRVIIQADVARVYILAVHGGVYVDMDYEALQPMETFLQRHFASLQPASLSSAEALMQPTPHFLLSGWENGIVINNALTIITPLHPVLLDYVLPRIHANLSKGLTFWQSWNEGMQVAYMAGPFMWTRQLRKAQREARALGIHLVSPRKLYPYRNVDVKQLTAAQRRKAVEEYNSLGYHGYDGSWHDNGVQALVGGVILGRPRAILALVTIILLAVCLLAGALWLLARRRRQRRQRQQQVQPPFHRRQGWQERKLPRLHNQAQRDGAMPNGFALAV